VGGRSSLISAGCESRIAVPETAIKRINGIVIFESDPAFTTTAQTIQCPLHSFFFKKKLMTGFSTHTSIVSLFFAVLLASVPGTSTQAQCTAFTKMAASSTSVHKLGIKSDGTLWGWGSNQFGQLGDGTTNSQTVPEQIGTATNWVDIAANAGSSYGITADGKLWAWGVNNAGQLGDGTSNNSLVPEQIGTATNWVHVSACESHCFAITTDHHMWGWGYGTYLNSDGNSSSVPVQIGTDHDWATVSSGNAHTIAMKTNGTIWGWGRNAEGEAGTGIDPDNVVSPTQIGTATNWVTVSCGYDHTLAVTADGKLWAWGANYAGEIGDGTTTNVTAGPEQIGTATNWKSVAGGYTHSLAITTDGHLWAWGENNLGELGDGTTTDELAPEQIAPLTNWLYVQATEEGSLGLTSDNTAWTWGRNVEGEVGDGTIINRPSPTNLGAPLFTGLAATGSSTILYQSSVTAYATDCANLIATVAQSGPSPVTGLVTANSWLDASVQVDGDGKPFLQRHYQLTPAVNASTSTGTVTLYFSQTDFTNYNAQPGVAAGTYPPLPVDPADAAGYKANLNFTKISGTSSDGSGSFFTYSGTKELIIPSSVSYANGRWQASFDVTSFSGFFATTGSTTLPLTWLNVSAVLNAQQQAQISWQVQEQDVVSYTVDKSPDGSHFTALATVVSKGDGLHTYGYTDPTPLAATTAYRISQVDKDGKTSYSKIMRVGDADAFPGLALYPNPASDHVFIGGLGSSGTYYASITDLSGKKLSTVLVSAGNNELIVSGYAAGVYLVRVSGSTGSTILKFVKR
jgi:alpha-tubulin suppressor-like RCC1 family protein